MPDTVRVRYAPSPTGEPHVGNIHSALFNWLFARHHGGVFVLRVEDTDQARRVEGAEAAIYASLRWLGLEWDEGPDIGGPYAPYVQSRRLPDYQAAARRLVEEGHAYYCYCSPQTLEEMRREQQQRRQPPRYDRRCRPDGSGRGARQAEGIVPVVRFKTPLEGSAIAFHDLVRGEISFDMAVLDDFVLLKSDGFPTYHLANVVDDHAMAITHVLRAEEWIPSTPRHILLYAALGYDCPRFGHLPLLLGPDRAKLSKRHGATDVLAYRSMGYLPEAMLNFLALLGWSLDDRTEVLSREELVRHFSLERVVKASAIFNIEKLTWMNGVYMRQLPVDDLAERVAGVLEAPPPQGLPEPVARPLDRRYLAAIVPLVQERLKTLAEATDLCGFFFLAPSFDEAKSLVPKGMDAATTRTALEAAARVLRQTSPFDAPALEGALRPLAEELGLKTGPLFGAIRLAVTGRAVSPPLFETMAVLGRERCQSRVQRALGLLASA